MGRSEKRTDNINPKGLSESARYFLVGEEALCCEVAADGGARAKVGRDYTFGDGYIQAKCRPLVVSVLTKAGIRRLGEVQIGSMITDKTIQPGLFEVRLLNARLIELPLGTDRRDTAMVAHKIARDMVLAEHKKKADARKARVNQQ